MSNDPTNLEYSPAYYYRLPTGSGFSARDKSWGPGLIMLSAMGEDSDRIVGLEVGADDYLPKPCNPRELLARIRAVLRRRQDNLK